MSSSAIIKRLQTLLETTPPFDLLSDEERQEVLADVSIEYFRKGEVILEQGAMNHPGLYIVESGLVRLMDHDTQQLVDKCQEGDFFGVFGLLKGGSVIYEAKALEPTVCALVRVGRFQKLYDENETFKLFFERDIRRYMRHLEAKRDVSGAHLLLSRRLRELVYRDLVTCAPDDTVQHAARLMRREDVGSVVVLKEGELAGLLTDGDLAKKLVARGGAPGTPVHRLMNRRVPIISEADTLFVAVMTMLRERVHRLVVTGEEEAAVPIGILTDRDIGHFRGLDPVATIGRIEKAPSVERLADIRSGTSELLLRLYRQGVQPEQVGRIMAVFYDRVAVRVLELMLKDMKAHFDEKPPGMAWTWMRLGSGGRQEAALTSKQHNALLYADPPDEEEAARAERWFGHLAEKATQALEQCGFPTNSIVASEARWQKPLSAWQKAYRSWIHQADEEALALVPFFFDLRGVYGSLSLVEALKEDLVDALNVQAMDEERSLLYLMARNALEHRLPVSFFGRFVLRGSGEHAHALDIRKHGILPVVDAARVLALELRYFDSPNTYDRLRHAKRTLPELAEPLDAALDAYQYFADFRLENQLRSVEAGEEPSNYIDPSALSKVQQNLLRSAFSAASDLQEAMAERYGIKRGWSFTS